jgi:NADPH-dependent curcumin reductase CurA
LCSGFTSLTAYYGVKKIAKVQPGDLVVISGAAGATGSIAGQMAKIQGARVLGLTSSNEKVQWLKEIGFDDALNYRDGDFVEKFKVATTVSEDCHQNKNVILSRLNRSPGGH